MFAALCIVAYLKKIHNSWLVLDPMEATINTAAFSKEDWISFYPGVKEPIPTNFPEPRGKEYMIRSFVDSDHSGDHLSAIHALDF